jgi:hypothetical protein
MGPSAPASTGPVINMRQHREAARRLDHRGDLSQVLPDDLGVRQIGIAIGGVSEAVLAAQ